MTRAIFCAPSRASIDQGMLPNRFPDSGESPEYNTVDATLWMFHAVHEFLRYTGDYDFVRAELYQPLADIIAWHQRGTRYGIHLDSDGLLHAGEPGVQLTWMDARVGDRAVTPRARQAGRDPGALAQCPARDGRPGLRFQRSRRHPPDIPRSPIAPANVSPRSSGTKPPAASTMSSAMAAPDASIRPNQIFAVSLPYPLITGEQAMRVIDVVEWELLTPYGLRTLSPRDPNYRGRYDGDPPAAMAPIIRAPCGPGCWARF